MTEPNSPPATDTDFVFSRKDGADIRPGEKAVTLRGRHAFNLWREHLAVFGHFSEFDIALEVLPMP